MVFEDRLTIDTPEGVPLELTLAGVGSRFTAALLDYIVQIVILVALALVLSYGAGLSPGSSAVSTAVWVVGLLPRLLGLRRRLRGAQLRTDTREGVNGLRVVLESGAPVTFVPSAIRNVIRIIDLIPGNYLVGVTAILVTKKNQRLGDLAGRHPRHPRVPEAAAGGADPASVQAPAWDTSAVSQQEIDAVAAFLARRHELAHGARIEIAAELAGRLRPKVGGASPRAATRSSSSAWSRRNGLVSSRPRSRLARRALTIRKEHLLAMYRHLRRPPGRPPSGEPPGRAPASGGASQARSSTESSSESSAASSGRPRATGSAPRSACSSGPSTSRP